METACEQTLAAGLARNGRRHRRAVLRDLDTEDRRVLLDRARGALPAERITTLLASTVVSIGAVTPVGAEEVRALSVGDRDRLVLTLRRILHGDQLECVFPCRCGERLELALDVGALLAEQDLSAGADVASGRTGRDVLVRVRPATGADHERAARRAREDPLAAARELMQACVVEARRDSGDPVPVDDEVAACAEALLEELDAGAEIVLQGDCPACGEPVAATFDPITHLWTELEQRAARLEREVHVLALFYHWSERDIVALDPARRARYLALLEDERGYA
jgi:hypothetical protein